MSITPFLAQHATERHDADVAFPGTYDATLGLHVVKVDGKYVPAITHYADVAELVTKTAVRQEQDDEPNGRILELVTKTEVRQEHDDEEK